LAAATPGGRPQACSYRDAETFRADLGQWLAAARQRLEEASDERGDAPNMAMARWLEYEVRTASEEIALLNSSPDP
jgi:hypothetical protein